MKKKRKKEVIPFLVLTIALVIMILFLSLIDFSITGFSIYESSSSGLDINDTYIRQPLNTNFGTQTYLRIGKVASGADHRILIKDTNISISPENTIISAKLQVYVETSYGSSNRTLVAYTPDSSWNEFEAGWNNRTSTNLWIAQGGDYSRLAGFTTISDQSGIYYNITITEIARGWINGSLTNDGLIILINDSVSGNYTDISSSESITSSFRPRLIIEYSDNAPPQINGFTTDSSLSNPKNIGELVNFSVNWTDLEGNQGKIYVCNTSSGNISGCDDKTYCSTSYQSSSPSSCTYSITSSENRTSQYYVIACDTANCSTSTIGYFYANHQPNIDLKFPDGGVTINQSQGNYLIRFNINDSDSDTLTGNIYYGLSQNSTSNIIATNINLTYNCTDFDSNTLTTNNCSYSWNSSGIYGNYFITIKTNDSFSTTIDSSNSINYIRSIVDNSPPIISSTSIDNDVFEGKYITIQANITDENTIHAWIEINTTPTTTILLTNSSLTSFSTSWQATYAGSYQYKVYANDTLGNLNNTLDWQIFTIRDPNATTANNLAPTVALPFHTIKIQGSINASDNLSSIQAFLNTPTGFSFLNDYPQNNSLGNINANTTNSSVWYISTPITENIYTLNITYTDIYSNSWQSSNFNINVSSATGGGSGGGGTLNESYFLSSSGYPEVETSYPYYVEAYFTNTGTYSDADTATITIIDSTGANIVGPTSMSHPSTGIYNYTYSVPVAPNEGTWKTTINATYDSISYYSTHFWKVIGGPFDVRTITIHNSSIENLNISFIAENTGGANKDLIMTWNLSIAENNTLLDSGGETFMVESYSNKTWYINPTTTYIGEVKITIIGYYSGTEKAGAYDTFTTSLAGHYCGDSTCNSNENCTTCPTDCGTCPAPPSPPSTGGSSGGGGGSSTTDNNTTIKFSDITILSFNDEIYLTKNIKKTIPFIIKNTGSKGLSNIRLTINGLYEGFYEIIQQKDTLDQEKTQTILIDFFIIDYSGTDDFEYILYYDDKNITIPAKIIVISMNEYFQKELERLQKRSLDIKATTNNQKTIEYIKECDNIINKLSNYIDNEEYIKAKDEIDSADDCLDRLSTKNISPDEKIETPKNNISNIFSTIKNNIFWIITWILIISLIIILIIIIRTINNKFSMMNYINNSQALQKQDSNNNNNYNQNNRSKKQTSDKTIKQESFSNKLKDIEDKLNQ